MRHIHFTADICFCFFFSFSADILKLSHKQKNVLGLWFNILALTCRITFRGQAESFLHTTLEPYGQMKTESGHRSFSF